MRRHFIKQILLTVAAIRRNVWNLTNRLKRIMTICNYCEKRETRARKFSMPFTCDDCVNNDENYAIDDEDGIITYIDSSGKYININKETELDIEIKNDKPINTDDFKDALLACLYSRIEDLKDELAEKNFIIRTLLTKNCEREHHNSVPLPTNISQQEESIETQQANSKVVSDYSSDYSSTSVEEIERAIITVTNLNSTEIGMSNHQEEEKEKSMNLKRQLNEIREIKHQQYINSSSHSNIIHEKTYCVPSESIITTNTEEINDFFTNEPFGWEKYSTGAASKIMKKMGYNKGKGLGKDENGIMEPIMIENSQVFGIAEKRTDHKKLFYILSSSMLNQMDEERLSNKDVKVKVQCHGGCTINCMYSHLQKMFDLKPDYILLHIGSNDCTNNTSDNVLSEFKMLTVYIAKELPHAKLFISLPIVSADSSKSNAIQQNFKLKLQRLFFPCLQNSNINLSHLCKKGLHLNNHGTKIMAKNIISLIKRM